MSRPSPLRAGFSAVWRRPSLVFAEIAWRWAWGLASLLMLGAAARAYLASLPFTGGERAEMRSGSTALIVDALARILQGSGPYLLKLLLIVLPPIALLWIVAASLGRAATLDALFGGKGRVPLRPLLSLHFLRAAAALAAVLAYVGSGVLAGLLVHPPADADPQEVLSSMGGFFLIALAMVFLVIVSWSVVNWFLTLAPVFLRGSRDGLAAVSAAVGLYRRRRSDYLSVGAAIGVVRLLWMVAVTVLSLFLLVAFEEHRRAGAVVLTALALVYFAVADYLFVARLAAYVAIADADLEPAPVAPPAVPPPVPIAPPAPPVLAPGP